MFRKMRELQKQLESEKGQLEVEVAKLQAILDKPEPRPFDEVQAAAQITAARSRDTLEGTKTLEGVTKHIDRERAEVASRLAVFAQERADAEQQMPLKKAQLKSVTGEIDRLRGKRKVLIDGEAEQLLKEVKANYQKAARELLQALIDFDALTAITANDPHHRIFNKAAQMGVIPLLDRNDPIDFGHWQLNSVGNELFAPQNNTAIAVRERYDALLKEIKGNLYGQ